MYQVTTKQPLTIGDDTSQLVIVTGWTKTDLVEKVLDKKEYAAIGQLYTPQGLNLLLRNLGANPQVTQVVGMAGTKMDENAGSMKALRSFFRKGFQPVSHNGRDYWEVSIEGHRALIDRVITEEQLNELRETIEYREVTSIKELTQVVKKQQTRPVTRSAWYHPLEVVESRITPGRSHGHVLVGKSVPDVWPKVLHLIRSLGKERPVKRGGKWQEIISLTVVVESDPFDGKMPDWLPVSWKDVENYVPLLLTDAREKRIQYTYGQRLRSWFGVDQVKQVIDKLVKEPDAASAVMSLWDTEDHQKGGSPCLNHIWLRIHEGALTLTALFRSNDMFGAWVLNMYGLIALQRSIHKQLAKKGLKVDLGPVLTTSLSAHIYEECWGFADELAARENNEFRPDPVGDFEIVVGDRALVVNHWNPSKSNHGERVKQYRGPLRKVTKEILKDNPSIQAEHALYLGVELARADQCRRDSTKYVQA